MRVAIVGCGVSGIAAAKVLGRLGHDVVLFERSNRIGGVWAVAYPNVRLQNIADHYRFTDYDWPFARDAHAKATDVLAYLDAAIAHFGLTVRTSHKVVALHELPAGWRIDLDTPDGAHSEEFDWVVVAAGHYTHEKPTIPLPGRDKFRGVVMTERDLRDAAIFDGKRVAVVGLGKSAVDMATFAKGRATEVHQIFRAARWLMPGKILGQDIALMTASRLSTMFEPAWVYPTRLVKFLHKWSPLGVRINGWITDWLVRREEGLNRRQADTAAAARMALMNPQYPISAQLRGTLAPDGFFAAAGRFLSALVQAERSHFGIETPAMIPAPSAAGRPEACEGCPFDRRGADTRPAPRARDPARRLARPAAQARRRGARLPAPSRRGALRRRQRPGAAGDEQILP